MKVIKTALVAVVVLSVAACADDPNRNAKRGTGIGAVIGGVIGNNVSGARGAPIVGAVVGWSGQNIQFALQSRVTTATARS